MIVVDTSALMAIALKEAPAERCLEIIKAQQRLLISAGTITEALIVAGRRSYAGQMLALIEGFGFEIVPVTFAVSKRVAAAYERWGKGVHSAALNLGDCFAYELATSHSCGLLYAGDDFGRTEVTGVL